MTSEETISVPRTEYEALRERNLELEDTLAALEADDGNRVPHEVALAIMRGESPVLAFRSHLGLTLRELSARTGIAASYLSEIERGRKPGSTSALARIAAAVGATIDSLLSERNQGRAGLRVAEDEPEYGR